MRKTLKTVARYAAVFLCVCVLLLAQMNIRPVKAAAVGTVVVGTYMTWALLCMLAACGVGFAVDATGAITQATQDTIAAFEDNLAREYPDIYIAVKEQVDIAVVDGGGDPGQDPDPEIPFGETFVILLTATVAPFFLDAVLEFFGTADPETGVGTVNISVPGHYKISCDGCLPSGDMRSTYLLPDDLESQKIRPDDVVYLTITASSSYPKSKIHTLTYSYDGITDSINGSLTWSERGKQLQTDELGSYYLLNPYIWEGVQSSNHVVSVQGLPSGGLYVTGGSQERYCNSGQLGTKADDGSKLNWTYDVKWASTDGDYWSVQNWNDVEIYKPAEIIPFVQGSPLRDPSNVPYIPIEVDPAHPPEKQTDPLTEADVARLIELYPDINPNPGTDPGTDPSPGTDPAAETYPTTDFISPPDSATQDDIDDMKAPSLIFQKFPFCIPWDLYNAFAVLQAEAVAPVFTFTVPVDYSLIGGTDDEYEIVLDLSEYELAITVFRWCLLVTFVVGLVLATRKLIGN